MFDHDLFRSDYEHHEAQRCCFITTGRRQSLTTKSLWEQHMKFTKQFAAGLIAGTGPGLMLSAALVELDLLGLGHKAWVSLLGIVLFFAGLVLARKPSATPGA
jgi:hypothetical protein